MENVSEEPSAEAICLRCGQSNPERASRCGHCGSPLDDFASGVPWEMGTANSNAYSESNASKPIIFWGAWVYFGLSGLASLIIISQDLMAAEEGTLSKETLLPLIMPSVYLLICIIALYSVTKHRLRK